MDGFPNLFMVMGLHTALGNIPRSIESNVEWIRDLLAYLDRHGLRVADEWTAFVKKKGEGLLANEVDSCEWCDRVAAGGYRELELV